MPKTKLGTYVIRVDDMAEFAQVAAAKNLSLSALLRLVIADFQKRERRKAAASE